MHGGNLAGNRNSSHGTVYVTNFNMYGGKICGNTGRETGGVYVSNNSSFNMYGGEITDNCTTYWSSGGGVYNYGSFTVSGSAKIYGNSIPSPNYDKMLVNNICLQQKINVGELAEDAYLGISIRNGTFNYIDGSFIGLNNSGKDIDYLLENHFFDDAGLHVHSLGDLIAEVPATCSAKGMKEHYTCTVAGCNTYFNSAKESVTKEKLDIPMTDHTLEKFSGINATCTEDGLTDGECCTVCKTVTKEQTIIPKIQHDYQKGEIVDPTETEAGYITYTCSNCGDSYNETIPALGHTHDYREEVIQPTCTEKGYKIFTCSGCGESYNDNYTDALGHDLETTEVEPNFKDDGYTLHSCKRCDYYYDDNVTPALGHDFSGEPSKWIWAENYFTAKATFECVRGDNCTIEIQATVDEKQTTATCTQAGDVVFIATVVSGGNTFTDTKTVSGTTIPHKYDITVWEWDGLKSAKLNYECSVCGDCGSVTTDAVIEKTEPTCHADGIITYM